MQPKRTAQRGHLSAEVRYDCHPLCHRTLRFLHQEIAVRVPVESMNQLPPCDLAWRCWCRIVAACPRTPPSSKYQATNTQIAVAFHAVGQGIAVPE